MKHFRYAWPYLLITFSFFFYLFIFHPKIFSYKPSPNLVSDYLRSQDIEDPQGLIHDRITVSDSDIYVVTGYLYSTGTDPTAYNFQHPPFIKYLYGFTILLTGNPLYIQIAFGLSLLLLTCFLGIKLFKSPLVGLGAAFLMIIDPIFSGMMGSALLDLGQAVFALGYIILMFFYPGNWIWQGVVLGLFASSKFWSTAVMFTALAYGYKLLIQNEKIDFKKFSRSLIVAFVVFALTYSVSFIKSGGNFNLIEYQGRVLRFMLSHNSAVQIGGPLVLLITGYFAPWWKEGIQRAADWSILWPVGLIVGVFGGIREFREKTKDIKIFVYLLPLVYLLLSSTQVPFTRYFIIILPFVYLGFANFLAECYHSLHVGRKI